MAKTAKKTASAKVEQTKADPAKVEGPATPGADDTQMTIADLQAIGQLIDVATRRGAFSAAEASDVGAIYTKLTTFLGVIAEQQKAADEAAE